MVEGGAIQVPESEILEGLVTAHRAIQELIAIQEELIDAVGVPPDHEVGAPGGSPADVRTRVEALVGRGRSRTR